MSLRRISARLQGILHSLATRMPKIVVLRRAEAIYPALNTSLVSDNGHYTDVRDNYNTARWAEEKLFANVRENCIKF